MVFSDQQIRTWSQRPVSILPQFTIDIVKEALADAPRLRWQNPEVFVQAPTPTGHTSMRCATSIWWCSSRCRSRRMSRH